MIYYQCQCGEAKYWGSGMEPGKCRSCEKCHTTLERSAANHRPPEPHDWTGEWAIYKGKPVYRNRCRVCYSIQDLPPHLWPDD